MRSSTAQPLSQKFLTTKATTGQEPENNNNTSKRSIINIEIKIKKSTCIIIKVIRLRRNRSITTIMNGPKPTTNTSVNNNNIIMIMIIDSMNRYNSSIIVVDEEAAAETVITIAMTTISTRRDRLPTRRETKGTDKIINLEISIITTTLLTRHLTIQKNSIIKNNNKGHQLAVNKRKNPRSTISPGS